MLEQLLEGCYAKGHSLIPQAHGLAYTRRLKRKISFTCCLLASLWTSTRVLTKHLDSYWTRNGCPSFKSWF